ncbi:unnamed protein product [Agarophyton chilense]
MPSNTPLASEEVVASCTKLRDTHQHLHCSHHSFTQMEAVNWSVFREIHMGLEYNSWELLFDYDTVRYFALLEMNNDEELCQENDLVLRASRACEAEDYQAMDDVSSEALKLFWPFIHSLSQQEKNEEIVRIQLRTIDGHLKMTKHKKPISDVECIENTFPGVKVVDVRHVERVVELCSQLYKVRVKGSPAFYFLKTVHRLGATETFEREITMLHRFGHHPNILGLHAVVEIREGQVEGILTPFIEGKNLWQVKHATHDQKKTWKKQIVDAVHHIHSQDAVWGDAKPDNIMIESDNNAILVDFEGGYSKGWVDKAVKETREGDLQAVRRICEYIDALPAQSK